MNSAWVELSPMLQTRFRHEAICLADGSVLVTGGLSKSQKGVLTSCETYNPVNDSWQQAAPMLSRRVGHTLTRLEDGRILAVGGESETGMDVNATCELYDPETNQWTEGPSYGRPIRWHRAVSLGAKGVLIVGGNNRSRGEFSMCKSYDPKNEKWKSAPRMNANRAHHSVAVLDDGTLLAACGKTTQNSTESICLDSKPKPKTWTDAGETGMPRERAGLFGFNGGQAILAGGGTNAVESWSSEARCWSELPAMCFERDRGQLIQLDDEMMIGIGSNTKGAQLGHCQRMDPVTRQWHELDPLPLPLTISSPVQLMDGRVLVTGGSFLGYDCDAVFALPAKSAEREASVIARLTSFAKSSLPDVARFIEKWSNQSLGPGDAEELATKAWGRKPANARECVESAPVFFEGEATSKHVNKMIAEAHECTAFLAIS